MQIVSDFIKNALYEVIFTVALSSGLIAFYCAKLKNRLNEKSLGIVKVHKYGRNIRSYEKAMKKARTLRQIAFVPQSFIFDKRVRLEEMIKTGCTLEFLFSGPKSALLREVSQMENNTDNDVIGKVVPTLNMLKAMKENTKGNGSIEVRSYNTEIRNPVTIFIDSENNTKAFLTVSIPPKRSIDCLMIEYEQNKSEDISNYFNLIWERHKDDVMYKT